MVGNVPGATMSTPAKKSFDLSNQADVLALLNFVRRSELDPELQNETRNVILDYINEPNDELEQALQTLLRDLSIGVSAGEVTLASADTAGSKVTEGFGHSRRRPVFSPPTQKVPTSKPAPASEPAPAAAPASPKPAAPKENVAPKAAPQTTVPPQPKAAEPVPEKTTTPTKSTVPTPSEPEKTVPKKVPTAPSSQSASERINEIKHLVNEKVGNPVNLIDSNNEVGRAYMSALLAAMKASSGGGEVGAEATAMKQLESAYADVETVLSGGVPDAKTPPTTKPEPAKPAAPSAEPKEPQPAPKAPAPTPGPTPSQPPPESPETKPASKPADSEPKPPAPEAKPIATSAPTPAATTTPTQPAPQPRNVEPPKQSAEAAPQQSSGLRSLAADLEALDSVSAPAEPKTASALPSTPNPTTTADSTAAPATTQASVPTPKNPSIDSRVTAGLDQLLSEWSLFKSSGIFGTGPNGREHPLYKNLSTLSMAAVISGRFEGSTPEIKQSITDYMNGWRYEQGVVHKMNETFEQYLRRVIVEILDKKPKTT